MARRMHSAATPTR